MFLNDLLVVQSDYFTHHWQFYLHNIFIYLWIILWRFFNITESMIISVQNLFFLPDKTYSDIFA